jgi:hypothetical protein
MRAIHSSSSLFNHPVQMSHSTGAFPVSGSIRSGQIRKRGYQKKSQSNTSTQQPTDKAVLQKHVLIDIGVEVAKLTTMGAIQGTVHNVASSFISMVSYLPHSASSSSSSYM